MIRIFLAVACLAIAMSSAWVSPAQAGKKVPKGGKICTTRYYPPQQLEDGSIVIDFTVYCSREGSAKRRGLR